MESTDVINRLLTLAGTIMEDGSAIAIVNAGPEKLPDRLDAVRSAGHDLLALAKAIDVVRRRAPL